MQLTANPQDLVGFIMPFVIDMVNRKVESKEQRFLISWGICILTATLLNLDLLMKKNWSELAGSIATVLLVAQATYKLYWEDSSARTKVLDAYDKGFDSGKK